MIIKNGLFYEDYFEYLMCVIYLKLIPVMNILYDIFVLPFRWIKIAVNIIFSVIKLRVKNKNFNFLSDTSETILDLAVLSEQLNCNIFKRIFVVSYLITSNKLTFSNYKEVISLLPAIIIDQRKHVKYVRENSLVQPIFIFQIYSPRFEMFLNKYKYYKRIILKKLFHKKECRYIRAN